MTVPYYNPNMGPLQSSALSGQIQSGMNFGDATPYNGTVPGLQPGQFGLGQGLQLGLGAIQTLGSLWNSFQQNKLANKALNFQTQAYETNLKNQTQSYNTALEDRIRARYATEGRSGEAESYIQRHSL